MKTKIILVLLLLPVLGWAQLTRPFGTGGSGGGGTVTAVTATAPLASSGGTTPNITADTSAGNTHFATQAGVALKAPIASPTFTGTVTTPLGAGTVRSSAGGVLSATASDTVGLGTSLAGKASITPLDTIKVKYGWYALTAGDSAFCDEVSHSGCTIRSIRAIRVGGTSASINVTKNGSSDLLTANYATTTSMASAGTLQNNTIVVGDILRTTVRAVVGTVTEIYIQILYDKPKK